MRRVSEFARLKGISRSRAYALAHSGALPSQILSDGTILLEESALLWEPRVSRPLSERMAWALLNELSGEPTNDLRDAERARVRQHVQDIAESEKPAIALASKVSRRSVPIRFRISADDIADLRADGRVALSGVGAPGSGMVAGDQLEGYVRPEHISDLQGDYLLSKDPEGSVLLRVTERGQVLESVIAADLADRGQAREVREANAILGRLLKDPR